MGKPLPLITLNELCGLCKYMGMSKGGFVEIGTRFGGTSRLMAETFPERNILTVDIKKQYDETTFADLDNLAFVEADSGLGPPEWMWPIGTLFIDGRHRPDAVHKDITLWSPHVEVGGFVILHDAITQAGIMVSIGNVKLMHKDESGQYTSGYPELGETAKRLLLSDGGWSMVECVGSCMVFQKGA